MRRRRPAMTLMEMLICLVILALCFVAMVRGFGDLSLLQAREAEDAALVPAVEQLIVELEGRPPTQRSGTLDGGWVYESEVVDGHYLLHVRHSRWQEQHTFVLRELKE